MTSDLDICRTANVLVREHGQDTPIHAAMRAHALLEAGDLEGCAVFKRVLRAVEALRGVTRSPAAPNAAPRQERDPRPTDA